jgi:DNA polymerase III subunit epsilon
MRQIFLDTETTGLSAEGGDRIVEIGCVELLNRKLTGNNLHFYLNPERDSHEEALRVHGLTTEFLRDKPKFAQVANDILAYVDGAEIIIHNAPFDLSFLNKELSRVGKPAFKTFVGSVVDSLAMAKNMFPGKRNSLDSLCDRLGVDNSGRTLHGALLDAELLADVFINMTRGQDSLVMDEVSSPVLGSSGAVDLSRVSLSVLLADEAECEAHEQILVGLDKSSKGATVWRNAAV